MSQLKDTLTKKISSSGLFVVLATKNYLYALRSLDGDILSQIEIARKFQRPFLIIIDKRLSDNETKEIDEYFSRDNIVKRIIIDINDYNSKKNAALEIKKLARELFGKDDEEIQVITPHSNDEIIEINQKRKNVVRKGE